MSWVRIQMGGSPHATRDEKTTHVPTHILKN